MLKSLTVAEKTAKNFRGPLFCRTLYTRSKAESSGAAKM